MLYRLARLLQFLGLVLLPVAIAGNVADPEHMNVSQFLKLALVGVVLFFVGWLLQQRARPGP